LPHQPDPRMSIQWFPGHMNAARKKAAESMEKTDLVIEVVDARLPVASSNPMIEQLRKFRQRPCLKILNKADLADPVATKAWIEHFGTQKDVFAVALSCKKPADVAKVPGLAMRLAPHRGTALKPLRMMIMGIPNVGKSTLINALLKRKAAKTGDEPAVTRQQSRFELDERHELIDTPGLMPPAIAHESDGLMLGASHLIGPESYDDEVVGTFLAQLLLERYPGLVRTRYGVEPAGMDGHRLISTIAKNRGYLRKGGEPHFEKAARALLQDYRSGLIGRVTLETPQSRAAMLSR
jgi:ribosome biogenesis GTPase A